MGTTVGASEFVERRKNKVLSRVLNTKDATIDPHLPSGAGDEFRETIMREVNDFAEIVTFVIEAALQGQIVNEYTMDLRQRVNGRDRDGG